MLTQRARTSLELDGFFVQKERCVSHSAASCSRYFAIGGGQETHFLGVLVYMQSYSSC